MLSVYTNQQDLLRTSVPIPTTRYQTVDKELFDKRQFSVTLKDTSVKPKLEFHVYSNDGVYLTGDHGALFSIEKNDTSTNTEAYEYLAVNSRDVFARLGISRGQYRVVYNFFDNLIGSFEGEKLFIKEISPSRRELRLQLSNNDGITLRNQYQSFKDRWDETRKNDLFDSFVLNFGFNETFQIVNLRFEEQEYLEIIVKLYQPLPARFGERVKLWISEEIISPIVEVISIVPKEVSEAYNRLSGPNFDLDEFEGFSTATSYKSWNDLLAANIQTSQQIIDSQFSGSLSGLKLNISYRIFDNFVHYSSAVERVKNFKYKLEVIENYTNQINNVAVIPGGAIIQTNLADLYNKRNNIVSSFDDFEKYLFFESTGSQLYTHVDETANSIITGSGIINPWPKTTPVSATWQTAFSLWSTMTSQWSIASNPDPYGYFSIQELTTSATAEAYYADLLEKAELYDTLNIHKLQNTVPMHLQGLSDSDEFLLFVHMLGQHFDILWTYIKALSTIHTREEHPKDGMPSDLLYNVAKSLGFQLLNGKSTSDLWRYALGVDANGTALQTNVNGISSISDSDATKEVWRRIVNNLPYILKSKGTSRAIKALVTCFGIPTSILTIKEYGGPSTFTDNDHYPEYVHDTYRYAWLSTTGSIQIPITSYRNSLNTLVFPDSLEFRFKTDANFTYSTGTQYNILSGSGISLYLTKDSADDNQGTVTFVVNNTSGSIADLEIFDHSWQHVVISKVANVTASLQIAKSLYSKTIYLQSASFVTGSGVSNPLLTNTITFATGSNKLFGHFQEIRLWSGSLNDNTIREHAASPNTYTINVDRTAITTGDEGDAPYEQLLQRFSLANTQIDVSASKFVQPSIHPNQKINTGYIVFQNYAASSSIEFEGFEETYYTPSPSLGGASLYTNKVRIESSSLRPGTRLNIDSRVERSSFDRYSIDSNRLGVYFSPQTAINEDIFNQLGYFEIDDYIGNPGDLYKDYYSDLTNFAIKYWKKYDNRNDFEAYFRALEIYDFTLFKYIKRVLPQRVNGIIGLVVEPNVLERSKVKLLNKPIVEDLSYSALITAPESVIPSAEFHSIEGTIENNIAQPSGEVQINEGIIEYEVDVNKLPSTYIQHRYIGKYKVTETGSYEPIQTIVTDSRPSFRRFFTTEYKTGTFYLFTSASIVSSSITGPTTWSNATNVLDDDNQYAASILVTPIAPDSNAIITQLPDFNFSSSLDIFDYTKYSIEKLNLVVSRYRENINTTSFFIEDANVSWQVSGVPGPIFGSSVGFFRLAAGSNLYQISESIAEYTTTAFSEFEGSYNSRQMLNNIDNLQFSYQVVTGSGTSTALAGVTAYVDSIGISFNYKKIADIQDYSPRGWSNLKFDGSKLTGPGINIDTPNTIDGGPVVKITTVNPNQLVFASNQISTIDQSATGTQRRSI